MFENLSDKLDRAFKVLKGQGSITEINVAETMKEIRKALLDADVNYKTAKTFTDDVRQKGIGRKCINLYIAGAAFNQADERRAYRINGWHHRRSGP
jgi:signal recognition particle subunit SRP54